MKIVIIDNYDSFTYNIAHYVEQFASLCTVIKVDKVKPNELDNYDKIILSPGPGLPVDRPLQNLIIKKFHQQKPILGICLGHQALAEYFGAKLINMDEVHHGVARNTNIIKPDYLWNNINTNFKTGRYHSWAVQKENLPENIIITSEDVDSKTIMSFKHNKWDIRGIQFHPESILTENGLQIIKNWVLNNSQV